MDARAKSLLAAYDTGTDHALLSGDAGFDKAEAYGLSAQIWQARRARGEHVVGRKIGFTNRSIWPLYRVDAPMWSWMYDSTVAQIPSTGAAPVPRFARPRLEPELAFKFARSPQPSMTVDEIAECIAWMALGFEVVTSPFPDWDFALTDCIAAQGLHGCFFLGEPCPVATPEALAHFHVTLDGPAGPVPGKAEVVLGGPLFAIAFLMQEIAAMPGAHPIAAGEIITTGTLTDAFPIAAGQSWRLTASGLDAPPCELAFD